MSLLLSVRGASVDVVQKEGRWKSDAYYEDDVRSHEVEAKVVSDMLADADAQPALQPSQRTVRYINDCYN